jgi:hypothetical protein
LKRPKTGIETMQLRRLRPVRRQFREVRLVRDHLKTLRESRRDGNKRHRSSAQEGRSESRHGCDTSMVCVSAEESATGWCELAFRELQLAIQRELSGVLARPLTMPAQRPTRMKVLVHLTSRTDL